MIWTPPVAADVVWHAPRAGDLSDTICRLAREIYSLLCHPLRGDSAEADENHFDMALRRGAGIPMKLGRPLDAVLSEIEEGAGASEAQRRILIVLLDENAYLRGARSFSKSLDRLVSLSTARPYLRVLLVALHEGYKKAGGDTLRPIIPKGASAEKIVADVRQQVGVTIAEWLSPEGSERTRVFLSHAHRDLPPEGAAAKKARGRARKHIGQVPSAADLNEYLVRQTRVHTFFDAKDIEYGENIATQLRAAGKRSILLSIRTDHQADSWWCQQEMLTAKELRLPIVAVSVLRRGQQRSSPYGGNVLELMGHELSAEAIFEQVISVWLAHVHFHLHGPAVAHLVDLPVEPILLSRPPELLDFALGVIPAGRGAVVLYPDPPLSTTEAQVLSQAHPKSRLVTPTTLFGRLFRPDDPTPPLHDARVAVSLSPSPDAPPDGRQFHPEGYGAWHVDAAMAHVTLCLIRTGASIAYGGHLRRGGYTRFLADLITAHNRLGAGRVPSLDNFVAAFLVQKSLLAGLPPPMIVGEDIVGPAREPRQLVEMRLEMAEACDARVVLGGAVRPYESEKEPNGYIGRFPGLVEESYRTLKAEKPIYLIAGFGGATRVVADALLGAAWQSAESQARAENSNFERLCADYDARDDLPPDDPTSLDEMIERIRMHGRPLREAAESALWNNGLTVEENRRLFESREPAEIAHLVIKGMTARRAAKRSVEPPKLSFRLFHGNVADAPGVQAYSVALFEGVPPTGDEAVLDERFDGAIRRVAERGEWPTSWKASVVSAPGARLSGDWAVIASLGGLDDSAEMPARVSRAYEQMLRCAARDGLHDIALTLFGVTAGVDVKTSLEALLQQIEAMRASIQLTLCATDERDYAQLFQLSSSRKGEIDTVELPGDPFINMRSARESPITLHVARGGSDVVRTIHIAPADRASPIVVDTPRTLGEVEKALLATMRSSADVPTADRQVEYGNFLASLLPAEVLRLLSLEPERPLDIIHDPDMAAVPWELLRVPAVGDSRPAVLQGGLRRRILLPSDAGVLWPPMAPASTRRVLVVIDPREDLGGARDEGDELERVFRELPALKLGFLRGSEATIDRLREALTDGWDALHYAGHAQFVPGVPNKSGLLVSDGIFNTDLLQGAGTQAPPFIFLNACQSARVRGLAEGVSGAPPVSAHVPLAEGLLRAGAQTLIGNFWRVGDRSALSAARSFYRHVLDRKPFGKALQRTRKVLHDEGSPHWANYMLYGDAERRW